MAIGQFEDLKICSFDNGRCAVWYSVWADLKILMSGIVIFFLKNYLKNII
jgi:hypothetical protein